MIKVYQIYYNEASRLNCFDALPFIPYFNQLCTKYFENEVIKKLILEGLHVDCIYFGVVSHKFLKTPDKGRAKGFKPELLNTRLERTNPDVLSFFAHMKTGYIFNNSDKPTYETLFNGLMEHLNLSFRNNTRSSFVVLQNHFIARSAIYEDYVTNYLIPSIDWLESQELANNKTKYKGYTFHTFVLERLFMAYLNEFNLNCESW